MILYHIFHVLSSVFAALRNGPEVTIERASCKLAVATALLQQRTLPKSMEVTIMSAAFHFKAIAGAFKLRAGAFKLRAGAFKLRAAAFKPRALAE